MVSDFSKVTQLMSGSKGRRQKPANPDLSSCCPVLMALRTDSGTPFSAQNVGVMSPVHTFPSFLRPQKKTFLTSSKSEHSLAQPQTAVLANLR